MSETSDAPVPNDLATEIQRAVARIYRRVRAERPDNQLGDTALAVLAYLVKQGPCTLRTLSDRERVTPPAMNQTVNSLAAAALVTRQPDPSDGRKVLVTATAGGVALATETRRAKHVWLSSRLEALPESERSTLLEAARIFSELADS